MVKSLFDFALTVVCRERIRIDLGYMPIHCKHKVLEFLSSHDRLGLGDSGDLMKYPLFGMNLSTIYFYLSDEVNDGMLAHLTEYNKFLDKITLIECKNVSDTGVQSVTRAQFNLHTLELRSMNQLTDLGLSMIRSPHLQTLDISGCKQITSEGLQELLSWNRNIEALYLNSCTGLDEMLFYHISYYIPEKLSILELDFLNIIPDSSSVLSHLISSCPNLKQLSLARFFQDEEMLDVNPYRIDGLSLRNVDLYANFFVTLPPLPTTLNHIRLSVSGEEDVAQLIGSLETKPYLQTIDLIATCREDSVQAIDAVNNLLCLALPYIGHKINLMQISVARLFEPTFNVLMDFCPNLTHLALDVKNMNNLLLQKMFTKGPGSGLRTLKMSRMRLSYRVLFAIARGARNVTDMEMSYMPCVDDRFLALLASNCRQLQNINFNGCRYVTDKGLTRMARRCPLREVRIRGTACTDRSLQVLADWCPQLEWISYADYSGRPRFTQEAIDRLKEACINKLIC
ncbi:unnamed protein product, partial [Mesorhabditis belari]|uniref:Uncharacterized protein n=1 Tax=Mesorhabditis belari TaxID=2138241 RepID=A0AAF3F5W1_9BILA